MRGQLFFYLETKNDEATYEILVNDFLYSHFYKPFNGPIRLCVDAFVAETL